MKGLLRKVGLTLLYEWAGRQARAAAEGGFGPRAQLWYWWWAGKKSEVGLMLALLATGLEGAGQYEAGGWVAIVGALALAAGLVDANWRNTVPPSFKELRAYRFAVAHGANITAGLTFATGLVATCAVDLSAMLVKAHLTCTSAAMVLAALTGSCGLLGIGAAARLSEPPDPATIPAHMAAAAGPAVGMS